MRAEKEITFQTININNSHDSPSLEDNLSIVISLNHENKRENCLLKYTASSSISKFFQKINGHETEINIQNIIDWYSKLDRLTKTEIISFNSPELIQLLCNEIMKLRNPSPEEEPKLKSQDNNNDACSESDPQELYETERKEEDLDIIVNSDYLKEDWNDIESTRETENIEGQYINKKKLNEKELLEYTKICSLKDYADTLIFKIDQNKLKEYFNNFSEENSKIKSINPELINNSWYITLPNWSNLLETLSFCQIITCTFILLHYEFYSIYHEIYKMPFYNELKEFFQENEVMVNELIQKKIDVTNDIFNEHNSKFLAKISSKKYKEKYGKEKIIILDELCYCNINFLKDLKNSLFKSQTNEEKLKILFEKVSFYSLNDFIYSNHFIYLEFRNFLRSIYNVLTQDINDIYRNIIYNTEKLKPIKEKYLKCTKDLLFENLENIDIVEYGSYFTGLCTEFSDIDILLVYKDKKTELEYGANLEKVLNKIKEEKNLQNLNITSHLINNNSSFVITITYDVSEEIDLNEINFSYKYLDGKINDLKKVNIDITITNNEKKVEGTKKTVEIIKDLITKHIILKPVVLYLKIYFREQEMYSTYKGGINSLSLICIARNILVLYEINDLLEKINSEEKLIMKISEKFGHYQYQYGIGKDGNDYSLKGKEKEKNKLRFVIKSPVDNEINVASGCYNSDIIIGKFFLLFQLYKRKEKFFST